MTDWKRRVGGDPWKNAIMLECDECDAVVHAPAVKDDRAREHSGPGSNASGWNGPKAFRVRRIEPETPGGPPSYFVIVAGRLFLVNPTRDAIRALTPDVEQGVHSRNVVVLSWQDEYINGLSNLAARPGDWRAWTSHWIWEEVLRTRDPGAHWHNIKPSGIPVTMFDRDRWSRELTLGVSIEFSYSLAAHPLLNVTFRCNDQSVLIDPILFDGSPIATDAYLTGIGRRCLSRCGDYPQFQHEIQSRHTQMVAHLERIERLTTDPAVPLAPPYAVDDDPVDVLLAGDATRNLSFKPLPMAAPASGSDGPNGSACTTVESAPDDLQWWGAHGAVLILCGGLIARERELVDPGYELDVPLRSGGHERMSILEWRLHDLDERLGAGVTMPVVLLTTPDTEAIVEQCRRRYLRAAKESRRESPQESRLQVVRSSAQLIPELNDDRTDYAKADDDGWILRPKGHLDAVRCLARLAKPGQILHGRKCALLFAFNNLGDITSKKALREVAATYRRLREAEATFGIELFRYEKPTASDDSRWEQLSACDDSSRPVLRKSIYGPHQSTPGAHFYSSLTWHVDLDRLPAALADLVTLGFASSPKSPGVLRQDLDMLTHCAGINVIGLVPEDGPPARSLYTYQRYLGVRTQDHVRHATFAEAFRKQTFLRTGHSPALPNPKPAFIITEPRYQQYVWGGEHIATLKGLPPLDRSRRIAETWEISLHPSGHSSAVLNADEMRPLGDVAEELADLATDKIDFMAKYLDCHQPLSVQVHPDATTGRELFHRRSPDVALAEGGDAGHPRGDPRRTNDSSTVLHVRDAGGKEENFFVLTLPGEKQFHLVLGFEQSQLRPMAHGVRRVLDANANRPTLDALCEREVCHRMVRNLCAALIDDTRRQLLPAFPDLEQEAFDRMTGGAGGHGRRHLDDMIDAFVYHLQRSERQRYFTGVETICLFGKEYLFAAIAVVGLIRALAETISDALATRSNEEAPGLLAAAEFLFGAQCLGQDFAAPQTHPLLRFFHWVTVPTTQCWIRVPPGTVHAWQGGGTFLVEIGETSDNTFRILDYGRELGANRREMHYVEAMYALNDTSVLGPDGEHRLIARPHESRSYALRPGLLAQRVDQPIVDGTDTLSFLMNPDGQMTLSTPDDAPVRSRLLVGQCRTTIVLPRHDLRIESGDPTNQVLRFSRRRARPPIIVVCLGGARWEAGVWREDASPEIRWCAPQLAGSTMDRLDRLVDTAAALGQMSDDERNDARLGVSWPGFCRGTDRNTSLFKAGDLESLNRWLHVHQRHTTVLSDFSAGALGEVHHPLGGLQRDKPGMIVNVGRGICVAFHHPRIDPAEMCRNELMTTISGVGRWLTFNLDTGTLRRAHPLDARARVFDPLDEPAEPWIRASRYFSAAGIVARHSGSRSPFSDHYESLDKGEWPKLHEALRALWKDNTIRDRRVVIDCAEDLALVVEQVKAFAHQLFHTQPGDAPTGRDHKPLRWDELEACFNHIVLTGQIGQYFGLVDVTAPDSRYTLGRTHRQDLLTLTLRERLGLVADQVVRSEIGVVALRETAGFHYYFERTPFTGPSTAPASSH